MALVTHHCSVCAGQGHNARSCPRVKRWEPPKAKREPVCIDCGERDRAKFYAHPTNPTGCQRRCKACDNAKRIANVRKSSGWTTRKVHLAGGQQFSRDALEALLEVRIAALALVSNATAATFRDMRHALDHFDACASPPSSVAEEKKT